jgi:hypothetical protein
MLTLRQVDSTTNLIESWSKLAQTLYLERHVEGRTVEPVEGNGVRSFIKDLILAMRRHPKRYLPESQISVFLDNHGMIGFAPRNTEPGDTIWDTENRDVLLIARKTTSGYRPTTSISKEKCAELDHGDFLVDPVKSDRRRMQGRLLNCHLTFILSEVTRYE